MLCMQESYYDAHTLSNSHTNTLMGICYNYGLSVHNQRCLPFYTPKHYTIYDTYTHFYVALLQMLRTMYYVCMLCVCILCTVCVGSNRTLVLVPCYSLSCPTHPHTLRPGHWIPGPAIEPDINRHSRWTHTHNSIPAVHHTTIDFHT